MGLREEEKEKREGPGTCEDCAYLGIDDWGDPDIYGYECGYFFLERDEEDPRPLKCSLKRPEWCPGWFEEYIEEEGD